MHDEQAAVVAQIAAHGVDDAISELGGVGDGARGCRHEAVEPAIQGLTAALDQTVRVEEQGVALVDGELQIWHTGTGDSQRGASRYVDEVRSFAGGDHERRWMPGERPSAQPEWRTEPWPGSLPAPSPATVPHAQISAEVLDAAGVLVRVSGRGEV